MATLLNFIAAMSKTLLESLILRHTANRLSQAS